MNTQITQIIKDEILKWPGITTEPNRFGGIEFLVNKKEMGHLHGEKLADLPFPVEIRKELVASGSALPLTFILSLAGLATGSGIQTIFLRYWSYLKCSTNVYPSLQCHILVKT